VKVKFDKEKNEWIELEKGTREGLYLDGYLKNKLDLILGIQNKDWDCIIMIDGGEGSGKSTLGFVCATYLSKDNFTLLNISSGANDAIEKLDKLPQYSVLMIDEGSLALSSKDAMSREQKKLIKIFNVCRQKNMIIIIISPSFFDLTKYISCFRSRFLLHVYTDEKMNRGRFAYFGKNKLIKLYINGRKNFYSYKSPREDFIGSFTNYKPPFYEQYQEIKKKSLFEALHQTLERSELVIRLEQRYKVVKAMELYDWSNIQYKKINQIERAKMIGITNTLYKTALSKMKRGIAPIKFP